MEYSDEKYIKSPAFGAWIKRRGTSNLRLERCKRHLEGNIKQIDTKRKFRPIMEPVWRALLVKVDEELKTRKAA